MDRLVAMGCEGALGGWVTAECVGESAAASSSWRTSVSLCASIGDVADRHGDSNAIVAMAVPMGLLDSVDFRACDRQAREVLGERRVCVWAPPSRPLLTASTYTEARLRVAELRKTRPDAKGLAAQQFALAPRIKEADDWLQDHPGAQEWLHEVHPELAFCEMAGHPVEEKKRSPAGQHARRRLVEHAFHDARAVIDSTSFLAKEARLPDILNAYAVLHAALRVASGKHEQLGGDRDGLGLIMRMVF